MIVDERMVTFIHSLETENSEILETIEKEALDTYVPIRDSCGVFCYFDE